MKRKKYLIKGRVQGVFFRKSTQERAVELGLSGWVKNNPDGSVYVEAQGREEALIVLEEWLHKGPTAARVSGVDAAEINLQDHAGFRIRA